MDCALTLVPARSPGAARVIGICQGWSNVPKAFSLVHHQQHCILRFFFVFSTLRMGWHQADHADHPFYLLCHQSAFMRLLAVAKGTVAGFKRELFICIKLAHGTHNFDFVEPECILSSADLEMIEFFLTKQSFPVPSHLIYSNAPLTARNLLIC